MNLNSNHCFVNTDLELLAQLFEQFKDYKISSFKELECFF